MMPPAEQNIAFDTSGLDSALRYLKNRTGANFRAMVESPGNDLAFRHYAWSNMDCETTAGDFWSGILDRLPDPEAAAGNAAGVRDYLLAQGRSRWLPRVLEYLPAGHKFDSTIYLNLGYDNIAFGGDAAINLNHRPFHTDRREAVYYLMHELAHVGYFAYNRMPDLASPQSYGGITANVMLLTHLEGMGVLTPLSLRAEEGALGDPDYAALCSPTERLSRVRKYIEKLSRLRSEPDRRIGEEGLAFYGEFSERPLRLWYVAGCHMAQAIEEEHGRAVLRELVRKGSQAFFDAYLETDGAD